MLSIIIPTKNEAEYLPKLLESIKAQDFQDYEIIVPDAESTTDRTKQIAKSYGCKIIKGGSPAQGRNKGAKASKGELLVFMDADTILPNKTFLSKTVIEIKRRKLDVAGTLQKPMPAKKRAARIFDHGFYRILSNQGMIISQRTPKPRMQNCMFATRKIHNKIGGFDETLEFGEDSEYCERAKKKGAKFRMLKKPGKILISPRRLEGQRIKMAAKCIKLNTIRTFGKEYKIGGKTKYF